MDNVDYADPGSWNAYAYAYVYAYSYNQAGRVTLQQMGVLGGQYSGNSMSLAAAYTWDNEGRMTSLQYPTGYMPYGPYYLPTAGYTYDVNGRLSGMTWDTRNGDGPQPYANATYGPAGQLMTLSYGAGTETRTYNSLLQLTSQVVPYGMNLRYNYSSTQNNGRITGSVDSMAGEDTAYSYDALNRLTGASNSLWSEQYGYDGFGNLTSKQGSGGSPSPAPSMSVSYDANNHQVGTSYDGNGNQVLAGGNTNSYTVENRMNSQYAVAWPYAQGLNAHDPWGKRVMRQTDPDPYSYSTGSSPSLAFHFYGITGQRLATVTCVPTGGIPSCFFSGQNVYFGKKLLVSNGVNVVTDRLGSVRANSQGEWFAYYPYGEERTSTVDGRDKFGTYFRDGVGQDYADQRYYGSGTGRFWSADPYMAKAGGNDPANPQSWNRYAYVQGDPVNFADPSGENLVVAGNGCVVAASEYYICGAAYTNSGGPFGTGPEDLGGDGGGGGDAPRLSDLVAGSITRIQADLSKPDCAGDFKSAPKTLAEMSKLGLNDYGETTETTGDNGTITMTGEFAQYNPISKSINLNSNSSINWADPSIGQMLVNGKQTATNYIAGELQFLGLPASTSMTAGQFMDMVILHELAHYDGTIGNPDIGSNEVKLWNDCVKQ
jgi:RHS repeat-associated protein